jgi:transcription initiation factor TFIIB
MKRDQHEKKCSRCGSTRIIRDYEVGEEICGECGLVVSEEIVDQGPEWRAFTMAEKESRSRTGMGTYYMLYDKGLSTVFSGHRDAKGKPLDGETKIKMDRLRRYDNRSKMDDTWRRNLSIAMAELDRMSAKLHLPQNIKEQSAIMYRRALRKDMIRGRSIDAFVAASVYAACRQAGLPRPLKEISKVSNRELGEVSRTYRLMLREMNIRVPVDDPFKFVPKIASKLNMRVETEFRAVEILREAKKLQGLSGKDPRGMAAAALYKASRDSDDKRVQKDVAEAAGTTEVTLRNRLRGLEALLLDAAESAGPELLQGGK